MQDPGLPLTVEERGEWGDPLAEPLLQHAIASYCPSHNITPQVSSLPGCLPGGAL